MAEIQPYLPYIIMAVNGVIAGWLAGKVLGGGGLIRDLVVGILGAFLGGWMVKAGLLTLPVNLGAWGNQILVSTIGALIIIVIARIVGR